MGLNPRPWSLFRGRKATPSKSSPINPIETALDSSLEERRASVMSHHSKRWLIVLAAALTMGATTACVQNGKTDNQDCVNALPDLTGTWTTDDGSLYFAR